MKSNYLSQSIKGLATSALFFGAVYPASAHTDSQNQVVEVAFVLDTTGSMSGLIENAKRKIWSIANTIVDINPNAEIKMGLVGYRDYGDEYVVKPYKLTTDIQGLYGDLLKFKAQGGGDTPEAVNEALDEALKQLKWTKGKAAKKFIFLVGDAPPHMDYDNGPKYPEILRAAVDQHITVNAVQAGSSHQTKNIWKDIASRGNGKYFAIPQDGGQITQIPTPYDDDIIQLQRRLDKTAVPYGTPERQKKARAILEQKATAGAAASLDSAKFYSKRTAKSEVVTGGADVISKIQNEEIAMEAIDETQLPEELRALSGDKRKAYLNDKLEERRKLQKEMADLVKKHDAFIKKNKPKGRLDTSFDKVVSGAIASQF